MDSVKYSWERPWLQDAARTAPVVQEHYIINPEEMCFLDIVLILPMRREHPFFIWHAIDTGDFSTWYITSKQLFHGPRHQIRAPWLPLSPIDVEIHVTWHLH